MTQSVREEDENGIEWGGNQQAEVVIPLGLRVRS